MQMTGGRFVDWLALGIVLVFLFAGASMRAHGQAASSTLGARRYMEHCASCHGADGKGGDKAAAIATTLSVMTLSDAQLIKTVHDGTAAGMPPFAQIGDVNIAAVVHYLRTLEGEANATVTVTGDIHAGRTLYFGKAQCSDCHMIRGQGGFIASGLTSFSRTHTADAILQAIVTPDSPVVAGSRVVDLTTRTGRTLTGVLRNEDNFNLALQTRDGRYHFFSRGELAQVHYTDHSLMPHDYGSRLTAAELNDIVSFLIVSSRDASGAGATR
jgi:cytochrome c oxidase cbb3-type subunit 3